MRKRSENNPRWRKVPADEYHGAEGYLRDREKICVTAAARFRNIGESRGHVWYLGEEKKISALLIHSRHSLFPVFGKNSKIPEPRFLRRFLGKIHIHSVQGLREDTEILETLMEEQGYFVSEKIEYDLMGLDDPPGSLAFRAGPAGLVLREPEAGDEEQLFSLQSAYEQEEVLPKNADFNPAACRYNLRHILSAEQVLVACLDSQVVGKINTNAESFTRFQIGGVYVRPDCRGLGIGTKMTAVFVRGLLAQGKGVTLFVKKRNIAARTAYRKTGFAVLGNYSISYL